MLPKPTLASLYNALCNTKGVKLYSQCNEENYLNTIFRLIAPFDNYFVDIGAGDGNTLSNTRLLKDYGWNGLMIDGAYETADVKKHFVTAQNIISILQKYKVPSSFDLLSYDTDGNDYYIIEEILLYGYSPRVIICEFNGTIENDKSITIKYNPEHRWNNDDYYGFSFAAGKKLAERHGYRVVFQNDALNMYLVRRSLLADPDAPDVVSYVRNQYHPHNATGEWVTI